MSTSHHAALLLSLLALSAIRTYAQPELEPWGNLDGIRVDGQLLAFGTSLRALFADGHVLATAKERQNPQYAREGNTRIVRTNLDSLYFTETVEDRGNGTAQVTIHCTAHADMAMRGVFFSIDLPVENAHVVGPDPAGIKILSPQGQFQVHLDQSGLITVDEQPADHHQRIDIALRTGEWRKDDTVEMSFSISMTGEIDREPIRLTLNTASPGRPFDGVGGNFRIQNTRLDPQVIDYCLKNLRVAWGRVELPWRQWQPVMDSDPLDSARAGRLSPAVQRAMEMAHTLSEKKIPIILSAWFPPDWAVIGPVRFQPGPDHIWGNPLNHDNDPAIYRSIADYVQFLKERYWVEVSYFSFNESDLGINIRQTPQEHDDLIKGLGAYFASRGLATRVLLGDNSDATTYAFIDVAMEDTAARHWMGAISFHSWRGWDTATLQKWSDAATKLGLPLLVAEGSIDAAAWHYPAVFREPSYALKEIGLYTRLLAICQPLSILQWQLTADYSLLAGGGIFGDTGVLRPTQRFWNLKQLSMTPEGLSSMPVSCDRPNVTVAALGDNARHVYTLHVVNDAATREVMLKGLPAKVRRLRIYTTSETQSVAKGAAIRVSGGEARFTLPARSFVTLIGGQ